MKKIFTLIATAGLAICAQAAPVTQEVTINFDTYMLDYDYNTWEEILTKIANPDPQITTISYEDGVFTIENILETGVSVEFTMPLDAEAYAGGEVTTSFTPTPNLVKEWGVMYIRDDEGQLAKGWVENWKGEGETVNLQYPDLLENITVIYDETSEMPFTVKFVGEGNVDYEPARLNASFEMGDLAGIFGQTAVNNVEESNAAEYYTLQGVRVMNPEKGIYIVRQGNKTTKVAK